MLIQKIKTYKWQALASLLMTGLMVASSLLQPRYLQEVLGALLTGKYEAIYSIGAWLIGVAVVGLVAGGLNVVLAAYIAQGVSSDLREDAFRKIQTFSYADIEQFNAGNLVVRMTNDINQIQNVVMMTFPDSFQTSPLVHRFVYPSGSNLTFSVVGDCSHGSLDFWFDCCHDGNDGASFCQVSNPS
ncbi:ABC transporter ATP-binding protein/permease [Streptococcus pneumoniae]|nr:ABC transporter ATP-binding protein/permease [Streptococcus pneumoniae]